MHISEGVLSPTVLIGGYALTLAGLYFGLKKSDYERLTTAAVLSAVFFTASLIHVPLGPGSVHLILNGVLGMLLGWGIFPVLFTALLLQAVLFRYGGIAVLGVNTFDMALPALLCHYAFRTWFSAPGIKPIAGGFLCGFFSVAGAALCTAAALAFTDEGFMTSARMLFLAHVPVMAIEGIISALIISFLKKTRPELLHFSSDTSESQL
ncbi:MAG: cobalt transporter CbiM [Mailhella sp.]|nr:cobalt transporter CbiM [Mailhella sp.]